MSNECLEGWKRDSSRTSLHHSAHQRGGSNPEGAREIRRLLFRTGLVFFLVVAGIFGLKIVLSRMGEPTLQEMQSWDANAEILARGNRSDGVGEETVQDQSFSVGLIGRRLKTWAEADRFFRSAEALEQSGLDEESVARLSRLLSVAPDHRAGQSLLLKIQMRAEKYAQVVPLCIRLLDQDSQQWNVKMALLEALLKINQTDACLLLADEMLTKEPSNLDVLKTAALAHLSVDESDEALALFDRMLDTDPQCVIALAGAGAICRSRGDWPRVLVYYSKLVSVAPRAAYYRELVCVYARLQEAGKAVVLMGQADSLYGDAEVSSWLRDDLEAFDPIRETVEYRSFADRLVGEDARKAIENIRRHEVEEQKTDERSSPKLLSQPSLQLIPKQ